MNSYAAIVHREGKSTFGAFFPDAPGCYVNASTFDELIDTAARALRSHLDETREAGLPMPEPRSLQAVIDDPAWAKDRADALAIVPIAPAPKAGRPKRVNINVDEFALQSIDRAAERAGLSRSRFLVESALKAAEEA